MKIEWNNLQIPKEAIATYEWGVDYAADVYYGEVSQSGQVKPGRQWVEVALTEVDIPAEIATAFQAGHTIGDSFTIGAHVLDGALRDAIDAPVYRWPRKTRRSTGEVVTSPRNIVDTGELRDSQSMLIEVVQ
jgi:hypothetical protein